MFNFYLSYQHQPEDCMYMCQSAHSHEKIVFTLYQDFSIWPLVSPLTLVQSFHYC